MGWIVPTLKGILIGIGSAATLGAAGTGAFAAVIGGAVVVGAALAAKKVMGLFEVEMPKVDTDRSRQATVKSTTEPYKIIYGQTLVSGPIAFVGTAGTDNKDLYYAIALAGHEVNDITDMHFDDVVISDAVIGGGSSAGGNVTGSGIFGPKNSKTIVKINKYLGTSTQTADSDLVAAFTGWTSAHTGKGIAYVVTKWTLDEDSQETWDKYTPQNIKALVQGKKLYDPRLEFAAVSTYGQDITNVSYIAYGDNPALCLVDYLINSDYGMGIAASKIDWDAVVTAADGCDASVSVPGGSESRFTCNGVLFGTDSHRTNINKILSSMNGNLSYVNGKYVMRAGIYEAPAISLNEDDLISGLSIKTSLERGDRFNTIKGVFIDPSQNYKSTEFPEVQLADALSRDNNEVLDKEIALNMTNSSYMAQRISNKLIQLSDQQKVVSFPANLSAMRVAVGDRVQVSIEELSWSNKVFQCLGWTFSEEGGVNLTLREDSSTSYADPAVGDYSTVSATGDIDPGFRGVPGPSGLSATAGLKNVELDWVNPPNNKDFESIFVYASPNGNFSSAVKIGETDGTQFVHDFANGIDAVSPGDTRYYWIRAIRYVGTSSEAQSNLEPNADPNTTVFATVGRVEWSDVAGSTNAPEDNATAGATVGTDLYDTDGITVLGETDVKNSILAQDILLVEVETGDVLDLETGDDVDIQNLGDVAIYVSDQNAILNSSITSVSNSLSSLQDVVVDLTTGVGEVYVQATAPVAGVGGIPDPIPDFSRWYDSDDNNHPYYWDGSAWQDLEDPRIGQNESDITNLQSSLTTTNSNVTTNASAISVLDTTVTNQGNSITSISSDVTALETTVNDASTGVAANATGLSNLTTRVTTAEGTITSQSSDITALQTDLTTAEGNITTNASGISGLDTRVTTAEGNITTNATDITALESTVNDASTGVAATASGLSALTTRVDTTESDINTNSSAITTLDASFTQDLEFRTKVKDETGGQLQTEDDSDVDLNELTDYVSGQSAATQALDVRTTASEDSITTQASQITALQSTVNDPSTGVDATSTALSSLTTRVTTAEGTITSQSSDITTLQSGLTTANSNIASNSSAVSSLDTRVTSAEGSITSISADVTTLQSDLTTAEGNISANSTALSSLTTRVTSAEGSITSQAADITTLQSDLTSAETDISGNATAISGIDTRVTSAEGSITSISSSLTSLSTTVGNNTTSISTQATSINGLEAQYTVKIDNNDRVAGFGLASTSATGTPTSEFVVIADKFSIVDPLSTALDPIQPFTVTSQKIYLGTDVEVDGDLITLGTISAERLQIDGVTLDTDGSGNLIIATDGVTSTQIAADAVGATQLAAASISKESFQADVNPVQIGSTLPASASAGDVFFLTTDSNLYRYNGTAWTKAITLTEVSDAGTLAGLNDIDLSYVTDAGTLAALNNIDLSYVTDAGTLAGLNDINLSYVTDAGALAALNDIDLSKVTDAGTLAGLSNIDLSYVTDSGDLASLSVVTSDYIAANAVIAGKIAAGAISTDKLAANAVTASKIDANTITAAEIAAGTITSAEILANTITAAEIAANTVTSAEIAANTITAAEIAAGTITSAEIAANTITASEIASNTITSNEIAANTITAGQIEAGAIGATEISVTNLAAISADLGTITAGSITSAIISGDIDTFVSFNTSTTQSLSPDDGETVIQTIVIPANTLGHTPVIHASCQIEYQTNFDSGSDYGVSFRVRDTDVTGTLISTIFKTRRNSSSGTLENDSVFIFATDTKTTVEKTYVITAYPASGNDSDDVDIDAIEGIAIGAR